MNQTVAERCRLCGTPIRLKRAQKNSGLCKSCARYGPPHPDFAEHCRLEYGRSNPEQMNYPFWLHMVSTGHSAYEAQIRHGRGNFKCAGPIWTFQRFGMSRTVLPDGRIVFIAGEHEDYYDPNFCIYNDVIVQDPDGSITIYGYPRSVFPPTDSHTATLVGDQIYLIGSIGYLGERSPDRTPVYRLDTATFAIHPVEVSGDQPGWIYKHAAQWSPEMGVIIIYGGKRYTEAGGEPVLDDNQGVYGLDLETKAWRRLD